MCVPSSDHGNYDEELAHIYRHIHIFIEFFKTLQCLKVIFVKGKNGKTILFLFLLLLYLNIQINIFLM